MYALKLVPAQKQGLSTRSILGLSEAIPACWEKGPFLLVQVPLVAHLSQIGEALLILDEI